MGDGKDDDTTSEKLNKSPPWDAKSETEGDDDDEEDPLDAFMKGVTEEVSKIKEEDQRRAKTHKTLGIVTKRKKRGERVFQNEGMAMTLPCQHWARTRLGPHGAHPKYRWNGILL